MKTKKTIAAVAVCCLGSLAATNVGQAALTQMSIGYYTDYGETIVAQGVSHGTVATAFSATRTAGDPLPASHSNPFVTFCLDVNAILGNGYWQSGGFSDVALNSQSSPAIRQVNSLYRAANLYNHYAAGIMNANGTWNDKIKGGALQLAIWEVLYETSGTFNVNSGAGFYVSSGNATINALANTMLASSWSAIDLNLETTFWNSVNADGSYRNSQDLIGPISAVPEPTTVVAGGLLLLPFLASTIRRRVKVS